MVGTEQFDEQLRSYFEADRGALSKVTATEAADGQVTVSNDEKIIVVEHFTEEELKKYQGNDFVIESAGLDARREFRLFPTGEIVKPKLKYPKPGNNELRLYFNNDEFKVRQGHYWGVFERQGDIWIFQARDGLIDRVRSGEFNLNVRGKTLEEETDDFQLVVNSKIPEQTEATYKSWDRRPSVAAKALSRADFRCELRPELPTFISRSSGKPFVEAHHLIPMKMQADFEVPLDIVDNICALSPFSHRRIHLAAFDDIVDDIKALSANRASLMEYANISEDELLSYYRV